MKAAVISLGSKSSEWTIEAMKKYFGSVANINIRHIDIKLGESKLEVYYDGKPLHDFDCVYAKGSFRYALLLRSITEAISSKTYLPISAEAFSIAHDKLLTHLVLQKNNISMPKTYLSSTVLAGKKLLEKVHYPIVMKFPHGTGGRGVMFADSYSSASSVFDALEALRQPFIIQEYIETGGSDVRVIVAGNKIIGSMKRKAVIGEKRSNIHAGGTGEPITLDSSAQNLAIRTAKAVGAEVCAVDMLENPRGGYLVIEANLSPGLQGITKATNLDVADRIAKYLFQRAKEIKDSSRKESTSQILEALDVKKSGNIKQSQHIFTNLDFRGERILLPKIVSALGNLREKDEVTIEIEKGKIKIEKN